MTDLQPAAPPVPGPDGSRPSATRRVRARLARRMTPQRVARRAAGAGAARERHRTLHPKADLALLTHAYEVADAKHAGQKRKSGDPYITHPLAVSTILAELGMDTTTLVAALLHDTVEDTDYSLDRLREEFGDEVAHLVDGVTKLDKVEFGNAAEAETIRKMVVAMARDPRVLVIKLSDRLHNMRTMRFLSPEKQAKKARETLEVMAPLAHRLGMATVKWELEDLSFAILHPKKYSEIVRLVATRAPSRDTYLKQVIDEVRQQLDAARLSQRLGRGQAQALLLDLPQDDRQGAATSTTSTTSSACACSSTRCATATPPSAWCTRCGSRCRAGSRTTSRSRGSGCTSRCTPR